MATYQNLVDGALSMLGRLASGDTATTLENTDFLIVVNELFDSLSGEMGPIFSETSETLTLTSGTATYTIGTGATLNTARPVKVLSAQVRISNVDYDMMIVTNQQYQSIVNKTLQSAFPLYLSYNPTFASAFGTLAIYPTPNGAVTIRMTSLKPLAAISALSDTISLPPAWQEMIRYQLAIRLADYVGAQLSPFTMQNAARTKQTILIANMQQEPMNMDPMAPGSSLIVDEIRMYTNP